MRVINYSVDSNEILLVPCSDWHLGSAQCDEDLIRDTCKYIEETPNCYAVLNGDLCDCVTTTSVGNVHESTMSPLEQVIRATYYLAPIAKAGKIVAMTCGNHERRGLDDGLTVNDLLLAKLMVYDESLNDRYCPDGAFVFLSLLNRKKPDDSHNQAVVTMYCLHGTGGGKVGNKIARLDAMQEVITADLFIRGHTHLPETHRGVYFDINKHDRTVREKSCVFVNCGSMLKYSGGYGARAGMKPLSRGIPLITIKIRRSVHHKKERIVPSIECVIKERLGE